MAGGQGPPQGVRRGSVSAPHAHNSLECAEGPETVLLLAIDRPSYLAARRTSHPVPHRPRHFRIALAVRTLARRAWGQADSVQTHRQLPRRGTRPQCKSPSPSSTRVHRPPPPHADRPIHSLVRPQVRLPQPLGDVRLCRPRARRLRRAAFAGPAQPDSAGRQGQGRGRAPAGDEEGDQPGRDGAEAEACQECVIRSLAGQLRGPAVLAALTGHERPSGLAERPSLSQLLTFSRDRSEAIVYTWDYRSSASIWAALRVQPILSDEVQAFKALITIHKILQEGHPVVRRSRGPCSFDVRGIES